MEQAEQGREASAAELHSQVEAAQLAQAEVEADAAELRNQLEQTRAQADAAGRGGRWTRLKRAWRGGVALLIVAASSANAQNTSFSLGEASKSCGTFVEAVERNNLLRQTNDPFGFRDPEAAALMSWIEGFISGENYVEAKLAGQRTDPASRYRWVENYCRGHPLDDLTEAALGLRRELIAGGMADHRSGD